MYKVGLFDRSFYSQRSMGVDNPQQPAGDDFLPTHFEWARDKFMPVTFFTDMMLSYVHDAPAGTRKIALLIEPTDISYTHYNEVISSRLEFDYVLTHNRKLIDSASEYFRPNKFLYYPFGLSYIAKKDWKIYAKTKFVSMIYSGKKITEGHRLRHEVANSFCAVEKIDLYGTGSAEPIKYKLDALSRYMFSVVIENSREPSWFTEKLIDCFATGTVPIYWGTPDIGDFFDTNGMIIVNNFDEIEHTVLFTEGLREFYRDSILEIEYNMNRAKEYVCPEDWIYQHYPYIFG